MNVHVEARKLTAHEQDASSVDYVGNMNLRDRFDLSIADDLCRMRIMVVVGEEDVVDTKW